MWRLPLAISRIVSRYRILCETAFSLALVPDLSNYALFIAIHDAYYGFGNAITAYSYTDKATDGNKVRYILRLAVKCNQNDTHVKDQAVDAVQA